MNPVNDDDFDLKIPGYEVESLLGKGGFGEVYRCRETSALKRTVAVKVIRLGMGTREILARFDAEMNALAKMNHSSICRVIDSGITERNQPYFAMEFIEGLTLDTWLKKENPDFESRLDIFDQLCKGISHAHERGVIHRDLKPGNVMITNCDDGASVKIIDFGLAKALHDPLTDQTLVTGDRYAIGTWNYMSPEQAKSRGSNVDTRSDIYSMGIMLYQLVSGDLPFKIHGEHTESEIVHVLENEIPKRPSKLLKDSQIDIPGLPDLKHRSELDWIVLKSIDSDPERRYATVQEFRADLLRYHKGDEPVLACPPGALYLSKKFYQRHKLLVSVLSMIIVSLGIGIGWALVERDNAEEAKYNAVLARDEAQQKTDEVLRLSAIQDHDDLIAELDLLWPALPNMIPRYEAWIEKAGKLVEGLPAHLSTLEKIRKTAIRKVIPAQMVSYTQTDSQVSDLFNNLQILKKQLNSSEEGPDRKEIEVQLKKTQAKIDLICKWEFPEELPQNRWWNRQLSLLVQSLENLNENYLPENMNTPEHGWNIPKRLQYAQMVQSRYSPKGDLTLLWNQVLPQINEEYPDLNLIPQSGLIPLGKSEKTGLWEFWHFASGEKPLQDESGSWNPTPESGLVFVLLPGGKFMMGAQNTDASLPNFDAYADQLNESPVHEVELSPFMISKYELTQGQWFRMTGVNPSKHLKAEDEQHYPVDSVDWLQGLTTLRKFSMRFPSEAQWEYSARAGSQGSWSSAENGSEIIDGSIGNICDKAARDSEEKWLGHIQLPDYEDGFVYPAPVGSFSPNRFGLHDMHGNMQEWCIDKADWDFYSKSPPRNPSNLSGDLVISRGGSFMHGSRESRSARRNADMPDSKTEYHGIRPIWYILKLIPTDSNKFRMMAPKMKPAKNN